MTDQVIRYISLLCLFLFASSALSEEDPTLSLLESNGGPGRLDVSLVDAVHDHWVLEGESVEGALSAFEEAALDEARPALERGKSHLTRAHLYWQHGDRESALSAVESALELSATTDGELLKARLLDAGGDESGAVEWYRRALESTDLAEEREFVRIRLAMIEVDGRNVEALSALAADRDQEFRNRAAITLAVLGHPDRALELYRSEPGSDRYFRQLVRVAEWALKAGDHETAREHAWRAYDATEIRFDALYALTLVDESYRSAGELDALVSELESRGVGNEDLLHLRIDLLIDLERYDDAIELYRGMSWDESDVEARLRLIGIYDTAGKSSEMVAEYERLIETEPSVVQWYAGLATHYINVAEPEEALRVWERFESRNRDRVEVLVLGGERMSQMGYVSEAVAMLGRHADAHGPSVYGNVFLFETHFARGRESEAERALEELREWLPADSSDLRAVADGFERLRRHDRALEVYEAIRAHEGGLGYDDRTRLAWLHSVVGNKEEALDLWQEIWVEEEAPARRSFAEAQFLLIAAELNVLADLAVDLETKLYAGEADRNEMNLLVRIYTEVGDAFSAEEIVKEFARNTEMPAVDRLRQLGLVYLQLQEYSKYDGVLRELERIDPDNRIEHIQNIVLNLLAFDLAQGTNERYADIQHWLDELRAYDEEAVSGEFEASVLSMGGFSEEAIESYRRALIEQPKHSDNLLLLADLMKESDRTMEAVALLQYVAEHAQDDNEFVVAVDGIINMVGQRQFFQELPPDIEAVFRWTHRVILERITGREGKFYLYTLLSEISQETNDREGEFAAMENSVSQAGIRRLAVLREIVTMATPNAGFFSIYRNDGDPERQLTYGRRLIGLRQQLPPEVYISIAKTLLDQGDTIGAEKSLSLVRDITGQIDVTKTKGDLFLAAGYGKRALAAYSQALAVNRDSLELQFKTAALREGNGQPEVANALYASALTKVMQGLPAALQAAPARPDASSLAGVNPMAMAMSMYAMGGQSGVNTSVTRDYRTYYDILMQGLIATWPESEEEAAERLQNFVGMFDEELAKILELMAEEASEEAEKTSLGRFARLDYTARLVRRLCTAVDQVEVSDHMDLQLAQHFADDEAYADTLHQHYLATGIPPHSDLAETFAELWPPAFSKAKTRVELAMDQAVEQKNIERLTRLSAIVEPPEPLERIYRSFINEGNYHAPLRFASAVLDEADFVRLLSTVVPKLQEEPTTLMMFLVQDPVFLMEIEDLLDLRLVEFNEQFYKDREVRTLFQRYFYGLSSVRQYLARRGETSDIVMLYEQIVDAAQPNFGGVSYEVYELHNELMRTPLDGELAERVKDATANLMRKLDLRDEFARRPLKLLMLQFDVDPANLDVFYDIVDNVQVASRSSDSIPELVRNHYEGDKDSAFEMLIDLISDDPFYSYDLVNAMYATYKDQYLSLFQRIRQGEVDDLSLAKTLLNLPSPYMMRDDPDFDVVFQSRSEIYESLWEQFPDDEELLRQLVLSNLYAKPEKSLKYLGAYYDRDKTDEFVRMAYYMRALEYERYDRALNIALDGGRDLRSKQVRDEIFERNDTATRNNPNDPSASILIRVRGASTYQPPSMVPEAIESTMERLQEIATSESVEEEEIPQLLSYMWRGAQAANLGDVMRSYYGRSNVLPMLLQWPSQGSPSSNVMYMASYRMPMLPPLGGSLNAQFDQDDVEEEIPTLLEVLIAKAPLGKQLEEFLIAMSPSERRTSTLLYNKVSQAYQEFPEQLAARLAELSEIVVSGSADDHEFTLWTMLLLNSESTVTEAEIDALVERAKALKSPAPEQLLTMAQLLARVGQSAEAADCYARLVVDQLQYGEFSGSMGFVGMYYPTTFQMTVLQLIEDAVEWLPKETAQTLLLRLLEVVRPLEDEPALRHLYEGFVVRTLSYLHGPDDVIDVARSLAPMVDAEVDEVRDYDGIRLVQMVRLHYLANDFEEAQELVRLMFTKETLDASTEDESSVVSSRYQGTPEQELQRKLQTISRTLGLHVPFGSGTISDPSYLDREPAIAGLFLGLLEDIVDFDNAEAVQATVESLQALLEEPNISQSAVLSGLSSIAQLHSLRDELDRANAIANGMQEWILSQLDDELDPSIVSTMMHLVTRMEVRLNSEIARIVLERDLLSSEQTVELLKAIRQDQAEPGTLEIARLADSELASLSLLREIRAIASDAQDDEYVQNLDERILILENAYESIELAGGLVEPQEST